MVGLKYNNNRQLMIERFPLAILRIAYFQKFPTSSPKKKNKRYKSVKSQSINVNVDLIQIIHIFARNHFLGTQDTIKPH